MDTSGDFKGGAHPAEEDTLYKMACENRDGGNTMVQSGQYEMAIGRYSELIMQTRALDNEEGIEWTPDGRTAVRMLRATAYLNLSLCFLKTEQWQHAVNTSTRAIQGDKDPPQAEDDVLPAEKKAKALFRRAQAHSKGFEDHQKATDDLRKALEFVPEDKAIQQELRLSEQTLKKASKAADKKMSGFLSSNKGVQEGKGLFDDKLRERPERKQYTEPMKLKDGLWIMPNGDKVASEEKPEVDPENVDYEEFSREVNELRESNPEEYEKLRGKIAAKFDEELTEMDRQDKDGKKDEKEEAGKDTAQEKEEEAKAE